MLLYVVPVRFDHYFHSVVYEGVIMLDRKVSYYIRSVAIALVFFALGRLLVLQMGTTGYWVIGLLLVVFYAAWWVFIRRGKEK